MWQKGSRPISSKLLRDPAEVQQYAQRGDPSIGNWPGQIVTRRNLMEASGDQRDWFRYRLMWTRQKLYQTK